MIDQQDVRVEGATGGKALWHRATHIPTGTVIEGEFKTGKALLEALDKAVTAAKASK